MLDREHDDGTDVDDENNPAYAVEPTYVIERDYGRGWEAVAIAPDLETAAATKAIHDVNEPGIPTRVMFLDTEGGEPT